VLCSLPTSPYLWGIRVSFRSRPPLELYFATHTLAVHPSGDGRVVTLEYEVHGKIIRSGVAYDNRFVSIAFIENRKIVRWRDYMDSLAAWTALTTGV